MSASILRRVYRRTRNRILLGERPQKSRSSWQQVSSGSLKGLWFELPPPKEGNWVTRILGGCYETQLSAAIGRFAQDGGTLFDIGAHIGYFTCTWLHLGGDTVEAFEPVSDNWQAITKNVERNQFVDRARIHPFALADHSGKATLRAHRANLGNTSMAFVEGVGGIHDKYSTPRYQNAEQFDIDLHTIDELYEAGKLKPPRVIKMDVEGAEWKVLQGAQKVIEKFHPTVLCEIHNIDSGMLIADSMTKLGYRITVLTENSLQPIVMWEAASNDA